MSLLSVRRSVRPSITLRIKKGVKKEILKKKTIVNFFVTYFDFKVFASNVVFIAYVITLKNYYLYLGSLPFFTKKIKLAFFGF